MSNNGGGGGNNGGAGQLKSIARQAMLDNGVGPDFAPAVAAQLAAIARAASEHGPQVRDLRSLLWCSIDNDDSRDLDQLSVAQPLADGAVRILVAIADVDASIAEGSPLDGHARANTTSVYTAAQVFPMFPERLSTDLTCLAEGQERLSLVIDMTVAADGTITNSDVYRARVVNRAKLAYNGVAAWLGGGPPPPRVAAVAGMDRQLKIQDAVAQSLKRVRRAQGALALTTLEAQAVYDGPQLIDLKPDEKHRGKERIQVLIVPGKAVVPPFLASRARPGGRRRRVVAARAAPTKAGGPDGDAGRRRRRDAPRHSGRARPERIPRATPAGRPGPVSGSVAGGGQAARCRRVRAEASRP